MRINTNVSSLTAQDAAQNTSKKITNSLEKLSTGLRINKASDDASGLAIADKLRTQATSINQGISNGNSAVSLLQIADKSMSEQSNILDTIKAKLIQANTDTTSSDGREAIRKDVSKLLQQLDNIAEQTNYNGNVLLQSSATNQGASTALSFQVGESSRDTIGNSAIQSNTTGLGSKVTYSAANSNNTLVAASTTTLSSAGAINLTSTNSVGDNTAETVSLSGDIDSLTLAVGTTISGLDAATKSAFETAYSVGTDYTQSGSSYTMLAAKTLDLSAISGTKTANITTTTEASGNYSAQIGDKITASTANSGSALAAALGDNTKFNDNLDGTYTAKTAASYTLETGESLDFSRATTEQSFTAGQTVALTADVVAGSELANALSGGNFTLTSGTAGTSGATYSVDTTTANVGIDDIEGLTLTTPAVVAPAVGLTVAVGDMVTLNEDVVADSALANALADNTKFEKVSAGVAGAAGETYKAIAASTTALSEGESLSKAAQTTVAVGAGGAYPAGSTLTLEANSVTGSDLDNQINNAAKFTLATGVMGQAGSTYTVKADFTTDNIKLVEGESVTMTGVENVATPVSTADTMIDDATMTFTPDGGAAVALNVSAGGVVEADAAAATPYQISQRGVLEFDVTAANAGETFNVLAGDTVTITTDLATIGSGTSNQIAESPNWVDNGDGSYTAIGNQTITFDDATDKLNVKRTIGTALTSVTTSAAAASDVERINTPAINTTVTGAANATDTRAPSSTVSVSFTTSDKVDVTNSGSAANTLTVTGASEISNGGTQLSALAALGAGEFTQQLANDFQVVVDNAITGLNGYRGDIGSTQNQVESAVRNLMTQATNVKAAESIIRDVDYAQESANFNKQNIISQAGSYAISQANAVQQNVLRLLQ
jgi:flagellin